MASASELLAKLAQAIRNCTRCELARTRLNAVPGAGNPEARVVFVGEAPGASEDRQGEPFVGAAGHLLDEMLKRIGLAREAVFITNIVKCRPPGNRTPRPEEIKACNDYLVAQLTILAPEIIVCIGSPSARTLIAPDLRITRAHGKPVKQSGIYYLPIYHPAAILRETVPREALEEDFDVLKQLLEGTWRPETPQVTLPPTPPPKPEPPEEPTLF